MSLNENYKNDIFEGRRKYRLIQNSDETISLDDVTQYIQVGDVFSDEDINATNRVVNSLETGNREFEQEIKQRVDKVEGTVGTLTGETLLSFPASGWSSTAPYTQTVNFPGVKTTDIPIYGLRLTGTLSNVTVEAQKLAWGYIDRIASGNGTVTACCYSKKPATSIVVSAKGYKNG